MITAHIWENKQDTEGNSVFECKRCGLTVGDIGCGVPNMFGAVNVEIDCSDNIIQQVHEVESATSYE